MNNVVFTAHIGSIERHGPGVKSRMAITDSWLDRESGEWKSNTIWLTCWSFRSLADRLEASARPGTLVVVSGRLSNFTRKTDQGEFSELQVTAQDIELAIPAKKRVAGRKNTRTHEVVEQLTLEAEEQAYDEVENDPDGEDAVEAAKLLLSSGRKLTAAQKKFLTSVVEDDS